jgi:hypothetical protein
VGGASAVLRESPSRKNLERALAAAVLLVVLVAYYLGREHLPELGENADVAFVVLVLIPAVFALVWLALPLRRARGLLAVALAFGLLTAVSEAADLEVLANFSKLAAATLVAFWFLAYFDSLVWIAAVAAVIPIVDSYSVFAGPTEKIVEDEPEVFTLLSFFFPLPGEIGGANLGIPDLLFFALFLAAAAQFGLRVGWTWLAMTLSFGLSLVSTVVFDVAGVPALPLLSLGFLVPNADLIWREVRTAWQRWRERDEDEA